MSPTALDRLRLRRLARIVAFVCVVVPLFNLATDELSVQAALQGFVDAFLIFSAVGFWILFVQQGRLRDWFHRLGFVSNLFLNSAALLAIFLVMRAIGSTISS